MNKIMSPNPNETSQDPIQHREHADRLSNLGNSKPAEINREIGLNLFKDMTLGRRFEDKCAEMYYRGKMFGFGDMTSFIFTYQSFLDFKRQWMQNG